MITSSRVAVGSVIAAIAVAAVLGSVASLGHVSDPPTWEQRDHSVIVTGDVIVGREVDSEILSGEDPFENVAPVFQRTDQVIVNLESPLTDARRRIDKEIVLKARPENTALLVNAGITAVTLANNHVSDYRVQGLIDTQSNLTQSGIEFVGAGVNIEQAAAPLFLDASGIRVAIVNFSKYNGPSAPAATLSSPGQAYFGTTYFRRSLEQAREAADFVIAVLHHGVEYEDYPDEQQIVMSRRAIEFGADVVIGHHPHVTQGIEEFLGKPIFYSIGNFVFDQETEPWDRSFFIAIDLSDGQAEYTLYPYLITKGKPAFMSDTNAERFFSRVNDLSPLPLIETRNGLGYLPSSRY